MSEVNSLMRVVRNYSTKADGSIRVKSEGRMGGIFRVKGENCKIKNITSKKSKA